MYVIYKMTQGQVEPPDRSNNNTKNNQQINEK